ncbi:probable terpene synthase 9 [Durio zibethinus]|uniref:(+)-delta-cadinene synthase n=1 Tax=Durio zibethinus TaxID=66656 RepID=A0A6P5WPQ7_DURZI|nr:probable terpene synthase 9 [Durio zibethinus]
MDFNVVQVTQRRSAGYLPTVWDPELIKSFSPLYTYESHGSRLEELKQAARCLLTSLNQTEEKLDLINTIQRLGVAKHFAKEINEVLDHVNPNIPCDLYTVALQFRLLRENGFFITSDVFNKFMDSDGKFKDSLREDVDGLLSLYEASYLGQHGEDVLDEAQTFSTKHLKLVMEKLENDLAEQVKESLHVPIYWRLPRMEARNFISIYQKDAKRNFLLLELAKLDFNLLQSVYLKELRELAEWWKDLNIKEKLPFARDRMVECYFWATGSVPEPQFYKCRRNLTKFGSLTTVLDDVYDIYGSMDELDAYTNAVNRWDLEAMEELPEYMKVCYSAMYNHVNEMVEDASNDLGLDILPYIRDQWVCYSRSLHVEAGWHNGGYMPTLDEYFKNAWISIGISVGLAYAFLGVLEDSKSHRNFPLQFFEHWHESELFYWPSLIARLLDDLTTSKMEMERGETTNSIQCHMIQEGVSEEEARAHIKGLVSDSWKKLNKFIVHHSLPVGFANAAMAMTRCVQRMYHFGDWFGIQSKANIDCVNSSLFNPV